MLTPEHQAVLDRVVEQSKRWGCFTMGQLMDKLNSQHNEIERLRALLKPFGELAAAVLSEAPADAGYISLFMDCNGVSHRITLDDLRAVDVHQQSAPEK